jgi:hypothetical protein
LRHSGDFEDFCSSIMKWDAKLGLALKLAELTSDQLFIFPAQWNMLTKINYPSEWMNFLQTKDLHLECDEMPSLKRFSFRIWWFLIISTIFFRRDMESDKSIVFYLRWFPMVSAMAFSQSHKFRWHQWLSMGIAPNSMISAIPFRREWNQAKSRIFIECSRIATRSSISVGISENPSKLRILFPNLNKFNRNN